MNGILTNAEFVRIMNKGYEAEGLENSSCPYEHPLQRAIFDAGRYQFIRERRAASQEAKKKAGFDPYSCVTEVQGCPHIQAKNFIEQIRTMMHAVHENAKAHGWWDEPREDGTLLMLVVSELAEAVEYLREDANAPSEKIPEFLGIEEELADAIIRILDMAGRKGYRLGAAIMAKHAFNLTRPHKHGGKKF